MFHAGIFRRAGVLLAGCFLSLGSAHASITDVIDHARTVIYAVIPDPSPAVVQALLDAKNRGVHLGVIVSPTSAIQRKLHRFGVHVWVGEADTPFVSADGQEVFVYGQTDESAEEAERYSLRFMGLVLGVPTGKDNTQQANPALRCGVPTAWICRHMPGLLSVKVPSTPAPAP